VIGYPLSKEDTLMVRLSVALLAAVVLTQTVKAAPIPADEKYEVKLVSPPQAGQVTLEKHFEKNTRNLKFTDQQGKLVQEQKESEIRTLEYERTVLKVEDKKVVKFTEKFTKAVIEDANGKRDASYLKRTITYERKDGKWTVTADEGPALTEEDLADLQKTTELQETDRLEKVIEPGKAVKIGDIWNPDGKKLAASFNSSKELQIDDTAKAAVKLLKVYTKDKQQWGSVEAVLDLPIKSVENTTVERGTMTMKLTMETPIDGSSEGGASKMTGTIKIKGTVDASGQKLNFELEGTMEGEQSAELKKK